VQRDPGGLSEAGDDVEPARVGDNVVDSFGSDFSDGDLRQPIEHLTASVVKIYFRIFMKYFTTVCISLPILP
jgi:hypothetical protein